MFLLTTRSRPSEAAGLLAAMRATGDVPEVAVRIDGPPWDGYPELDWPEHWDMVWAGERVELTAAINGLLARYPGRGFYAHFSDHFRPLTPGWSKALIEAAGDWFIAWPSDQHAPSPSSDRDIVGCPTYGGKLAALIREHWNGALLLPSTLHVCTTRPPWLLWRDLGIGRHVEAVRFDRTWPLPPGRVKREFKGLDYNDHDYNTWREWEREEAGELVAAIRSAMIRDGYRFGPDGRIDPSYGCAPWKGGL